MIYAHWLAVRCSVQHRRPMFSRTAQTVRLYLYHKHYVLSFLSFGPSSGEVKCRITGGCRGVRMLMRRPVGLCFMTALVGVVRWAAHYRQWPSLLPARARSGPPCGVWAGVRLDEPTTGERFRNLQESDVSLQQRLQVSRVAHGLVVRNLRNEEYRHWCDHPAILRQCCTPPRCMLFAGSHGERLCRRVGDSQL